MLNLSGIGKSFGAKCVLADFNLHVRPGELVFLSGPSGSGKTSILEIAAGLLRADVGTRTVSSSHIGYAFQDDCLVPWLSVAENILLVLKPAFSPGVCREKLVSLLADFSLEDVQNKKPGQLSGGMKRRLNIARAFSLEPALLLLDEPFAFQDEAGIERITASILKANSSCGASVIIASHTTLPGSLKAARCLVLKA